MISIFLPHLSVCLIILANLCHVESWHSILTDHAHLATHISHTIEHLRSIHTEGGPHVPGLTTDVLKPTTHAFSKEFVEESERLIVTDIRSTYSSFKQATVPTKVANAIAGVFAEVAAGGMGGLISRSTANVLGVTKKDSLSTKIATTASSFGLRQVALSGFTRVLGVPRPLAMMIAALIASAIKIENRATEEIVQRNQLPVPDEYQKGYYLVDGEVIINMDRPRQKHHHQWKMNEYHTHYCGEGEFIVNLDPPPPPSTSPSPGPSGTTQGGRQQQPPGSPIKFTRADFSLVPLPSSRSTIPSSRNKRSSSLSATSSSSSSAVKTLPAPPSKRRIISLPEVAGDVSKWMVFDSFVFRENWISTNLDWTTATEHNALYFLFGVTAAMSGKLVQDASDAIAHENDSMVNSTMGLPERMFSSTIRAMSHHQVRLWAIRRQAILYMQAGLEGGVLFGTYEVVLSLLQQVLPEDWNKPFLFEELLESMENLMKNIDPTGL